MRTRNQIGNADTAARLRRGLNPTQGRRAVESMARTACFSQRHFHRLTLQLMGETPGTHQRRLRLDRAAWLLLTSRATVLEIALETGFESHETFTRAFRIRFGETPSSFRKSGGESLPQSIRIGLAIATAATSEGERLPDTNASRRVFSFIRHSSFGIRHLHHG